MEHAWPMDESGFRRLLTRLSTAWERRDAEDAAACFTPDAVYVEPPDRQLFTGTDQLTAYFSPLPEGIRFEIHGAWFDRLTQTGAFEFTFGVDRSETADHGVAVVELREGRIAHWREYHRPGPRSFARFSATEGKKWQWHAANYP